MDYMKTKLILFSLLLAVGLIGCTPTALDVAAIGLNAVGTTILLQQQAQLQQNNYQYESDSSELQDYTSSTSGDFDTSVNNNDSLDSQNTALYGANNTSGSSSDEGMEQSSNHPLQTESQLPDRDTIWLRKSPEVPTGQCTSLSYLEEDLADYNQPDLAQLRQAILGTDICQLVEGIESQGQTIDAAITGYKNRIANSVKAVEDAKYAISEISVNPDQVFTKLREGSFSFSNNGNMLEQWAIGYVTHSWAIIYSEEIITLLYNYE
jgi:hypothetical protein